MADIRVSNVDKHTKDDELAVRLCNYVDVYKNDRITQQLPFMQATASADEIQKFRLHQNDVVITKDSETWNDIGVPALVTEPSDDLETISKLGAAPNLSFPHPTRHSRAGGNLWASGSGIGKSARLIGFEIIS